MIKSPTWLTATRFGIFQYLVAKLSPFVYGQTTIQMLQPLSYVGLVPWLKKQVNYSRLKPSHCQFSSKRPQTLGLTAVDSRLCLLAPVVQNSTVQLRDTQTLAPSPVQFFLSVHVPDDK